jgi:predicted transcriptional regulator
MSNVNYSISPALLKAAAANKKLGPRRLARLMGVSPVAVFYWMTGQRGISRKNREKLLRIFPELRGLSDE